MTDQREIPDALPESRENNDREENHAARELPCLQAQTEATRAALRRLQEEVLAAEGRLSGNQARQLLEANEHLVLSVLDAMSKVETVGQSLKEVARAAERDALTGLPNRVLFLDRFAHAIASARRRHVRLALMFIDLNDFKQINDSCGHAVGDAVLKLVAHCLTASVRETDTVSRHGGGEFLVLLNDVSHASDIAHIAEKVSACFGSAHHLGPHVLRLTASIGVSMYPDDGDEVETLINLADAAMYRAKQQAQGGVVFHGESPSGEQRVTRSANELERSQRTEHEIALADHESRHAQLREANENLVMAALGAQALQAAAEQAHLRQTELLAVVAHELRNPLTPISTAAAMLAHADGNTLLLPRLQAIIERQVLHMSRLVNDLLDVSRAVTGKFRIERQVVDMRGIIAAAVDACQAAIDARCQNLCVNVPDCVLNVYGDPVRLAQIITNLLDNASKYTPDGGKIGLSVVVSDHAIVMTVSDDGIGISAKALPNVFEPFVRDAHAVGFNRVGLGIGLTVVRELVEAHGGQVAASSPGANLGSSFVVTLPLFESPALPAAGASA